MVAKYIELYVYDLTFAMFSNFNRSQKTNRCWKKRNGVWTLENDPFVQEWDSADIITAVEGLRQTTINGGIVYGAFMDHILIGFASVENMLFGENLQYLQLSNIYVSSEHRRKGVGRKLFHIMCKSAQLLSAKKLYISANSSEETQAFFKSMNCMEAAEYHMPLAQAQPSHCQLECSL